ncbi:MAG: type 1 periplasmic binding fold superfamily protein [Bacteroidota bacterium]
MIKEKFNLKLLLLLFSLLAFSACDDDDDVVPDEPENPEEEFTTIKLIFDDESTADDDDIEFIWKDLDGDGGNDPEIDDIVLESGKSYELEIEFLNENENPVEDVTEEIEREDKEHQVFFLGSAVNSLISIDYDDMDDDGNPLGLENDVTVLQTGGPEVLNVILRHELDKDATGASEGNPDNAGGETEVDINFNVTVQ